MAIVCAAFSAQGANKIASSSSYVSASNKVVRAGWVNVDEGHYLAGRALTPEALNSRIVIVHRWCIACPDIDKAVKDFNLLSKQFSDTDFVFMTSYYPGSSHPRDQVDAALKKFKVSTPVYVGAAPVAIKCANSHRALYVVEGGDTEKWSLVNDNTDIDALAQHLRNNKSELMASSIRLAVDHAPGRAVLQMKRLAKINPKKAKELSSLVEPLNTPENRQMADYEEKAGALIAKPNPGAVKNLLSKLRNFAKKAPETLSDEIAEITAELESL